MSKKLDAMGDRMKQFEMAEAGRKAMPGLPLLVRLDGRSFHTFTRGLKRPFDPDLSTCMVETTRALVDEFNAAIGYTQSDEISLLFPAPETLFDGRFQKLTSVMAGYCSAVFARLALTRLPTKASQVPCFDARAWQVPTKEEAVNAFMWREDDAVKNSVTMAAAAHYSHKQLMNKNTGEKHDMLHEKGVNWNDFPAHFKRGVYLKRKLYEKTLTAEELNKIPEKYRPKAGQKVIRSEVVVLGVPPIRRIGMEAALKMLFSKEEA